MLLLLHALIPAVSLQYIVHLFLGIPTSFNILLEMSLHLYNKKEPQTSISVSHEQN